MGLGAGSLALFLSLAQALRAFPRAVLRTVRELERKADGGAALRGPASILPVSPPPLDSQTLGGETQIWLHLNVPGRAIWHVVDSTDLARELGLHARDVVRVCEALRLRAARASSDWREPTASADRDAPDWAKPLASGGMR